MSQELSIPPATIDSIDPAWIDRVGKLIKDGDYDLRCGTGNVIEARKRRESIWRKIMLSNNQFQFVSIADCQEVINRLETWQPQT